jgi:hypothetical protein
MLQSDFGISASLNLQSDVKTPALQYPKRINTLGVHCGSSGSTSEVVSREALTVPAWGLSQKYGLDPWLGPNTLAAWQKELHRPDQRVR